MSSDNVYGKLFKAWASIGKMVVDGTRKPEDVLRYAQRVVDNPGFVSVLDDPSPAVPPRKPPLNVEPISDWAAEWKDFYRDVFDMKDGALCRNPDFTNLRIPARQPDYGWVVVVARALSLNQVWTKCRERFATSSHLDHADDLSSSVVMNKRIPEVAYAVRIRDYVNTEERLQSCGDSNTKYVPCMSLLERLLLELWFNWRTGGHLDVASDDSSMSKGTACVGSYCLGTQDHELLVPTVICRINETSPDGELTVWGQHCSQKHGQHVYSRSVIL